MLTTHVGLSLASKPNKKVTAPIMRRALSEVEPNDVLVMLPQAGLVSIARSKPTAFQAVSFEPSLTMSERGRMWNTDEAHTRFSTSSITLCG